ncbi:FUSC family protein [Romboutsia sp. 13368]|uniref:FUSC family protein n=1 Tax=Romboutsia sp. 13368 TaxID=2708053 RepID=UPI0025E098E0|nr:aromatic acid exporter family protein [Romboutsia sp. 13368]
MKLQKIGMRTIKTGIAVAVCTLLARYLVHNPMYAGVGCVVSVQDTVKGSFKLGFNRVLGTFIGGLVGFLCVLINPGNPIIAGLGIMASIYICTTLDIKSGIVVSAVTFLLVHLGIIDSTPAHYAISRVIDTSVGVAIGIVINYILARPDYCEITDKSLENAKIVVRECIKSGIVDNKSFERDKLRRKIAKLENIYSKLNDEIKFSKSSIDIEAVKAEISSYKEINHHMKSIELLDEELYLSDYNYLRIKEMYDVDNLNWEIDNNKSPVFNYLLSKILDEVTEIESLKIAS